MHRERFRVLNVVIVVLCVLTMLDYAVLTLCQPEHGVQGVYYGNTEWKGDPDRQVFERAGISTETLKHLQQQFPNNEFSAEWQGLLYVPVTGEYSFSTNSDDGSWLFLDEVLVVDNGGPHGLQEAEGTIHLQAGLHALKVRYFQIGGYAALEPAWAPVPFPRQALRAEALLSPSTNRASFWLYLQANRLLPGLGILWGLLLLWIGFGAYRSLRRRDHMRFERHISSSLTLRAWTGEALNRLCVQPALFAGRQITNRHVLSWLGVAAYSCLIFLTLSYARAFSTYMMGRYGSDIFSHITSVTLVVAGSGLLAYFLTLRTRLLSRSLAFGAIVALYGFVLNPGLREIVTGALQFFGLDAGFLTQLDLYPIYAGEKVHFLEYGLLGLLLCKTLSHHLKDKAAYLLAVVIVYLIGMTDEGLQWALPSRVGEYRDIWMNFLSGGLAILAVALVIRPRAFTRKVHLSSLRPLAYTLAAAVVYTGLFLQVVHGFGTPIFMPDSGTEFVSAFSEYELLQIDKHQSQRFKGEPVEELPGRTRRIFAYEARRHQYLRDKYYQNRRFFDSHCEQEILSTYFRSFLRRQGLTLLEYEDERFGVQPDVGARVFYRSEGQELAITAFTQRTMWLAVWGAVALLCGTATLLPASPKTRLRLQNQGKPRAAGQRVEGAVVRPLCALLLVLVGGISLFPGSGFPERQHTNLLILTVDSCQPDYWGAYGAEKDTTPFFDDLASEGVLFTNAIVPASWTIPSLTSMLTGVSPNVHGIDTRGKLMDRRIPTLFEALEQAGYEIGDTSYTLTEPSINSVFKKAEISPEVALSEGRSEESYLLSWLEEHQDRPFFGWVHFHTSHLPYRATPPYNELFLDEIDPHVLQDEPIQFVHSQLIVRKGEVEFDLERHPAAARVLYAQTLRQQDAKIGKVLQRLEELGLRENTLVVITADHGDELFEHGFVGHASTSWDTTVYDDLINVPLLLYYPKKLPQGKRIDEQVRMIDLMPTVLDILDVPLTAEIQGKSYVPLILGNGTFQEPAFSETTPCGYSCPKRLEKNRLRSVRTNEWKLISVYDGDTQETRYELYHLAEDAEEQQNVIASYPEVAAQFKEELQSWMTAPERFPYQHQTVEETHYLDVDVEVRPIVLFPKVGTVLTPQTHNKRVLVNWIGDQEAEYLIEYDVGTGGYHMTGELDVVGNKQWFGPFPEDIWQALPLYNPWKFRIVPKAYPEYPSDWITFEMGFE